MYKLSQADISQIESDVTNNLINKLPDCLDKELVQGKIEELMYEYITGQKTSAECANEWTEFTVETITNGLKESTE